MVEKKNNGKGSRFPHDQREKEKKRGETRVCVGGGKKGRSAMPRRQFLEGKGKKKQTGHFLSTSRHEKKRRKKTRIIERRRVLPRPANTSAPKGGGREGEKKGIHQIPDGGRKKGLIRGEEGKKFHFETRPFSEGERGEGEKVGSIFSGSNAAGKRKKARFLEEKRNMRLPIPPERCRGEKKEGKKKPRYS